MRFRYCYFVLVCFFLVVCGGDEYEDIKVWMDEEVKNIKGGV